MSIGYSTISGNYAQFFGGVAIDGAVAGAITNSTISGNRAHRISGVYTQAPLTVSNSTIAFNLSEYGSAALFSQVDIEIQSTIISGNETVAGGGLDDLAGADGIVVTGANNLIVASQIPVPPDTITACPHLMPLGYNGGVMPTHALRADSVAIDHGNNARTSTRISVARTACVGRGGRHRRFRMERLARIRLPWRVRARLRRLGADPAVVVSSRERRAE